MSDGMTLQARLDLPASEELATRLHALRGRDLILDAAGVDHLGAHAAQTLLIARHSWATDGKSLTIAAPSDAMRNDWTTLGLDPTALAEQDPT